MAADIAGGTSSGVSAADASAYPIYATLPGSVPVDNQWLRAFRGAVNYSTFNWSSYRTIMAQQA